LELFAQAVERYDRPIGEMPANVRIFAGAGQAAHEHDLALRVVERLHVGVAPMRSEIHDPRVVRSEAPGRSEAPLVFAMRAIEIDVQEDAIEVRADTAANVGLGDERQEVASRDEADLRGHALRVVALDEVERDLVITHERADVLAKRERHAELPE